jgi:uncharacterized protein YidB (DUF937 family)
MGLLDVINGMQNGPRGQTQPSPGSSGAGGGGGGGMSPITMALMGLLAYKAIKSFTGTPATGSSSPSTAPAGSGASGGLGGVPGGGGTSGTGSSLGDLLAGGLGTLFGGSSAGKVLSGALGNLTNDLQSSGQGRAVQSWIGTGPNQAISPASIESALGSDTIDTLARQTGMNRDELLNAISQHLPGLVDRLTPHGRLPTPDEAARIS